MRPAPIERSRDLVILVAISVLIAIAVWTVFVRFTVDDAFIAYRHARHLARGLGPVMNPGERVEGVSNLPWTLVLGAVARLGIEPHRAGPWLSMLCGLACIPAAALVSRRWTVDRATAAAAALLTAVGLPLGIWSASGMETSSVALVLLGLAVSCAPRASEPAGGPGLGTGIALGLLAILRPEGAIFALPVLGCVAVSPGPRGRRLGVVVLAAAGIFLPVVLFRILYYGDWLPNPVYAKLPAGTAALAPGLAYVLQFAVAFPLALAAGARLAFDVRRDPVAALVVGVLAVQLGFAFAVGGDHFPAYRFAAPLWPLLAVAMARGLVGATEPRRSRLRLASAIAAATLGVTLLVSPSVLLPFAEHAAALQRLERPPSTHTERLLLEIRHLGLVLVGLAIWWGRALRPGERSSPGPLAVLLLVLCLVVPTTLDPRIRNAREPDAAARYGRPVGEWLATHLPARSLVATNAAGSLPYFSDLPVVDMLGLTDRRIARRKPDAQRWIGHERGDGRAVLDRRPAVIVFGGPEGSLAPWPFRSDQEIAADPEFQRDWVPERVPLEAFDFVFYRRRDVELHGARPGSGL